MHYLPALLANTSGTVSLDISFIVSISSILAVLGAFLLFILNTSNSGVKSALSVRNAIIRLRDYILYTNQTQDIRIDNIEAFLEKNHGYHSRTLPQVKQIELPELEDGSNKK